MACALTTNTTLQIKYGWHPTIIKAALGVSQMVRIDSPYFRDMVAAFQLRSHLTVDGLIGSKTYAVLRLRSRDPSLADIEWLARVITAESGQGLEIEQTCVGWTVINRILTAPRKYGASPERVARSSAYAVLSRSPSYQYTGTAKRVAVTLLCDRPPDPTKGATHFYSPINMPRYDSPQWPGEDKAKMRHYYQDRGRYFLWTGRRQYTSTSGGWESVVDGDGKGTLRSQPGWATRMTPCDVDGVRGWRYKFYR